MFKKRCIESQKQLELANIRFNKQVAFHQGQIMSYENRLNQMASEFKERTERYESAIAEEKIRNALLREKLFNLILSWGKI